MKVVLFYENITNLDYACLDDQKGVMGNTLKVHLEMTGERDSNGVISDFSEVKKRVKGIIDNLTDHKLIISEGIAEKTGNDFYIKHQFNNDFVLEYRCPEEAVCEIPYAVVNDENLGKFIQGELEKEMGENIVGISLILEEEENQNDSVWFHYTHGLKNHYGNCQRLLHGHRNTVRIFENDKRRCDLEKYLAMEKFSGSVHFAFYENLVNAKEVMKSVGASGCCKDIDVVHLRYRGSQGRFELKIPGELVYLVFEETSIENLSVFFHGLLNDKLDKKDQVIVQAFEGIGKGAISRN